MIEMNAIETKPNPALRSLAPAHRFDDQGPFWLSQARGNALAHFRKVGIPTLRDEDWRFTNVTPLAEFEFEPAIQPAWHGLTRAELEKFPFAEVPGIKLIFINGIFAPELSSFARQPGSGARVMNLAAALATDTALVQKYLFSSSRANKNAFSSLNAGNFQDGAFVYVPTNKAVPEPIQLLSVSTLPNGETAHPRNLIIAERGSQVTVLETFISLNQASHLTNSVTEIFAGENAAVEHLKFQAENQNVFHIAAITAHCGRASNVTLHSFALGAKLSRTNMYADLAGEGLGCVLNGLYLTRGWQLADHFLIVNHAAPRCASHEYFNGILAGESKGVFHGRIHVRPGAQKTDAKQTNKNLLLSDSATINAKPQLEIYADDVKCTHGATIGQLDDEAIFYLRSRGISLQRARNILIHAFAGEIIGRVRCERIREGLDELVWRRLEESVPTGKD